MYYDYQLQSIPNTLIRLPAYLDDFVSNSDQEQEDVGENSESGESVESSDIDYTDGINNILAYEIIQSEQLDNLNTNLCTFNNNVKILISLVFVLMVAEMIKFVSLILNKVLGLGKA